MQANSAGYGYWRYAFEIWLRSNSYKKAANSWADRHNQDLFSKFYKIWNPTHLLI